MVKLLWFSKRINFRYKKSTRIFSLGIIFSSILLLLLITVSLGIKNIFEQINESNIDAKQIVITDIRADNHGNYYNKPIDINLIQDLSKREDIDLLSYKTQIISSDI